MHRLTTASFVLFVVLSLTLGVFQGRSSSSVMEDFPEQPAAEAPVAIEATEEFSAPDAGEEAPVGEATTPSEPVEFENLQ